MVEVRIKFKKEVSNELKKLLNKLTSMGFMVDLPSIIAENQETHFVGSYTPEINQNFRAEIVIRIPESMVEVKQ